MGVIVPKFTMYDGTNVPLDHIMNFRQLITLDIGNDSLMCKVQLAYMAKLSLGSTVSHKIL